MIPQIKPLAAAVILLLSALNTQANIIFEIEPNSLLTPQNVENAFSSNWYPFVPNHDQPNWEWVSIIAAADNNLPNQATNTNGNFFDFFSFEAAANQSFIFDIDFGAFFPGYIDTTIGLWSVGGDFLGEENDNTNVCSLLGCLNDLGSFSAKDPLLEWTFTTAGTYMIGVGEPSLPGFSALAGSSITHHDGVALYQLNISRNVVPGSEEPPNRIPAPTSVSLLGLGLVILGLQAGKKKGCAKRSLFE